MTDDSHTYEENFHKLQELVSSLESQTLGLEESLRLFEEGMALARQCDRQLGAVEERIKVLTSDPASLSTRADIPLEAVTEESLES